MMPGLLIFMPSPFEVQRTALSLEGRQVTAETA